MDGTKAKSWEADLKGTDVAGWTVRSLLDYGKSAAVFRADGPSGTVALKVFDDEIIERYGDKVQIQRIERELTLIGKSHPNMVTILGGGVDSATHNHFIVMEFLDGPSLQKCLKVVPDANVPMLIQQLASACEYLEALGLAHRDIKPANIVILDDYSRLVLLDFGVLKPVGQPGPTDADGARLFVGTLQYSSPEFLLREEDDTEESWRALSLYQVGGVLHDLIVRQPLFQEYLNPYARLVNAVQFETPSVSNPAAPSYLVDACRGALVKDPATRLKLVNWDSFRPPPVTDAGTSARDRITKRVLLMEAEAEAPIEKAAPPAGDDLIEAVVNLIKVEARRIRSENAAVIPPLTITRVPKDSRTVTVRLRASPQHALPDGMCLELEVDVLDVDAQAVSLGVLATASSESVGTGGSKTTVFRAVFNSAAVSSVLQATIFTAIDRTQTSGIPKAALDLTELGVV